MSNCTKESLIQIPSAAVPAGTLAMKVGNEMFTPGNIRISSVGMDFYKCAPVDTAVQTWTDYLAVPADGVYTFESTATTGLTYGTGFTPAAGNIYDTNAAVKISALFTGGIPYRYLRWYITATRSNNESTGIQAADFELVRNDGSVADWSSFSSVTLSADPEQNVSEDCPLTGLTDGDKTTYSKWCSSHFPSPAWSMFDFGEDPFYPVDYKSYRWYTVNDWPERDPLAWEIQVFSDSSSWVTISSVDLPSQDMTTDREALAGEWNF